MAAPLSETQAQAAVVQTELAGDATHQAGVFPPFDATHFASQIIWLAIVFGALYVLMSRVALPRVGSILDARKHRLAADLDEAARMQTQAKAASDAYDKTLADARAGAQALAQQTHEKLQAESDAKRHALEADLNAKLATAEAQISETKSRAMSNVAGIAQDTAMALVEHLTGRAPSPEAVTAAISSLKTS